ncbi:Dexamethasone-induced Ras- protein 1 [Paramecium bursaria]
MGNLCISEDAEYTIQPRNNINVLVVGSSGVGKSTIVNKIVYDKVSKPQETTSHQYHYIFNHNMKIKFIDTSGIPHFQRCIPQSLISKCQVVMYVCTGDLDSLDEIISWRKRILHTHKRILVINKKQPISDDLIHKIIDLRITFSNILYFDVDEPNYILEEILLRQIPESTKIQLSAFQKQEEEVYEPLTIQYY